MKQRFLDTPQKWLSLGAICVIGFLLQGMCRVYSLLYIANMTRYGVSRKSASIPLILFSAVVNIIGPVAGYLNSRIGIRVVIILGCLIVSVGLSSCFLFENFTYVILFSGAGYGIGFGFSINSMPHAITYRFSDHIDKANGMFFTFSSVGGLMLVALTDFLLKKYGTSGTYLILGALTLHSVPAAILLWKPKQKSFKTAQTVKRSEDVYIVSKDIEDNNSQNTTTNKTAITYNSKDDHEIRDITLHESEHIRKPPSSSLFKVFLDPGFILVCIAQSITIFVYAGYLTTLVDASLDKGVKRKNGYEILLGAAAADIFGRFFAGFLTDGGYITGSSFAALTSTVLGISLILYVWFSGYILVMIIMCISSLCLGIITSIGIGIIGMIVEKQNVRMATASRSFLFAPLSIFEPYVIGYFRDTLRSYNGLYLTLGILSIANGVLYFSFPKLKKLRDRQKERRNAKDQGK